jgi:hypothetical protein
MRLDWQRTMLVAAAAALPGLMVLGLVVLAKGRSAGGSVKLSAEGEAAVPRTADGMPVAGAVPRPDAFRTVGEFVREEYDARKRGRELARRACELVAGLERADRFPTIEPAERAYALMPRARRPGEAPPDADQRRIMDDEGLGVFVVDQVRAGRTGISLGEAIQDEIVRRKRLQAEARAAQERERLREAERLAKLEAAAGARTAARAATAEPRAAARSGGRIKR